MRVQEILQALQSAQGDPDELTLATARIVAEAHGPGVFDALVAAAVPHWFDAKILARLLDLDESAAVGQFDQLKALSLVEEFAARKGWNVHETTRLSLRKWLARQHPGRLTALSRRAAKCFDSDSEPERIERLFHQLWFEPGRAVHRLEWLSTDWRYGGRHDTTRALALALDELRELPGLGLAARARMALELGWLSRSRLSAKEAEAVARNAVSSFESLGDRGAEGEARALLGHALQKEGRLGEALAAYTAAKTIMVGLTGRDPENTDWQRELSASQQYLGRVLEAQGRLGEALAEYTAAKTIMVGLAGRDPENTDWQRGLSVSHNNVGGVLQAQRRLGEALAEYTAAKTIRVGLTGLDPSNTDWQRELSVSHFRMSEIHELLGRIDLALEESEADLAIAERLAAHDPSDAQWKRDLDDSRGRVDELRSRVRGQAG